MVWVVAAVVVVKVHSVFDHSTLVIGTIQVLTIVFTMIDVIVVQPQSIIVRILLPDFFTNEDNYE